MQPPEIKAARVMRYALRHNPEFAHEIKRPQVTAEIVPLAHLREASRNRWRAAAWFLERTHPERYARRKPRLYTQSAAWDAVRKAVEHVLEEFKHHPAIGRRVAASFQRWADDFDLKYRIDLAAGNERFVKHQPRKPEDEEIIATRP